MAERYVSALATAGAGTEVDPWTWAQMLTAIENDAGVDNGDRCNVKGDGTHVGADVVITRDASLALPITIESYTNTIGDGGEATIQRQAGEAGAWINFSTGFYYIFKNLIFDGNNVGDGTAEMFYSSINNHAVGCTFKNSNNLDSLRSGTYLNCRMENLDQTSTTTFAAVNCLWINRAVTGVAFDGGYCFNCIVIGGNYGYRSPVVMVNCIAYGCVYGMLSLSGTRTAINCILASCTTGVLSTNGRAFLYNCDFDSNGTDKNDTDPDGSIVSVDEQTLAPQFIDPAGYDFRRSGKNLDVLGLNEIGMLFDYGIDIGPYQNVPDNPSEDDVRDGVSFDYDQEGNLELPSVSEVEDGVEFGAEGTEYEGTLETLIVTSPVLLEVEDDAVEVSVVDDRILMEVDDG